MTDRRLNLATIALAVVGLALSVYLVYVHYNIDALVCTGGGCETVQTSEYSEMFGIPIAWGGVLLFLTIIAGAVLRDRRPDLEYMSNSVMLMMLVVAVIYWAYLTYLELNVIHAVCQWCVITSIVTVIILAIEAVRNWRQYQMQPED